jgi:hypothetical protein
MPLSPAIQRAQRGGRGMKNDDVVSAVPLAGHYRNRTSPRRVPQITRDRDHP